MDASDIHPRFHLGRKLIPLIVVHDKEKKTRRVPGLDSDRRYLGVSIAGKKFWNGKDALEWVHELQTGPAAELVESEFLGARLGTSILPDPVLGSEFDFVDIDLDMNVASKQTQRRHAMANAEMAVYEHFKWMDGEGLGIDENQYAMFGEELSAAIAIVTTRQKANLAASWQGGLGGGGAPPSATSAPGSALDGSIGFSEDRLRPSLRHANPF